MSLVIMEPLLVPLVFLAVELIRLPLPACWSLAPIMDFSIWGPRGMLHPL